MSKQLTKLMMLVIIGMCCLTITPSVFAAGGNPDLPDSVMALMNKTALTGEPSLQYIFDSLGYDINVATDETGMETFCTTPGQNLATIVIEVAGSAATARSGWYVANDTTPLYQLFSGGDDPGDSVTFSVSGGDSIGFWMKPRIAPDTNRTWYTQNYLNYDGFNHAKVFRTGVPHEFIVAFEDLPNGGDTDWNDLVFKVRFSNQAPVITLPADINVLQCSLAQICFAVNASDPDCQGDTITVTKQSGPGTFTQIKQKGPVSTNFCWTPAAAGTYQFVFKVKDELNATDFDTINVTVTLNTAPVANAGRDSTLFQCTPAPICITASCTDANSNLSTCQLVSGPGTYNGSTICFTPASSGTYTLVLKATDACGLIDYDTSVVNVTLNQAPIANAGNDSTLSQCTPAPICVTASCSDPNGNLSTCQLVSGPGTYNGSAICFTPAASGSYTFVLKATDACGLTDFDTSVVNVTLNQAPIANAGNDSTLAQCTPAPICVTASCSDPSGNLSTCQLVSGPGTYNGSAICFTPAASGSYTFVLKATDACGLTDFDTSVVNVTLNQAPIANAGNDSTLFQCTAAPICVTASCSDPNGNLSTCQLVSGPGTYNGSAICFTPAASGSYTFVLKATDACGLTDFDTSVVNVTLNQAPIANAGIDSTLFQCTAAPICVTASCSDPNGNLSTCQLVSGPGTYNGSAICFTPAASGSYTFVLKATDACGLTDFDTSVVNVTLNQAPVANAGNDSTLAQCTPAPICVTASCSDPNGNLSTCQLVSGPGTYNGSAICFTPAASGSYTFVLKATDACGLTDFDTSVVNVTLNQAPVANAGSDSTLFQCTAAPICVTASCSDPNGNLSTCQLVSGPGTYNGSAICFTPAASGSYTFVLKATDACGLTDFDTSVVNVTLNQAPVANAGNDSTLFQCTPAPICVTASCSDPNGNLSTCQLVSGPGTYNGSAICFTPAASGSYTFVLKATDACGLTDFDTSVVNVTLNQAPVANAGNDSTLFQCTPAPICVTASCSDPNGNLSTCQLVSGPGTYNGSAICFTPAGAGVFTFVLKATDACGATDFDTSVVTVSLNQPPVASMGNDSTLFQCGAAPICIPASCSDPNGNLSTCQLVSGPGSYNGSDVCFTPAGAGVFTFVLKATDACGATDFDTAVVTVALNLPPVANAGRDSTLFQCAPAQICITAGCSDPDANLTNCELTSGPGTLNGGGICFTPAASGIYTFIVKATDACGLTDFDTSVVNVTLNQAPVATVGNDSTLFQCTPAPICIAAACSDPNGNLSTCQLVSGPGTYNGSTICFTPASSGSYTLVLKATDACGLTDFDTSVVNVTLNVAPIANAGRDSTLFQCTPAPICIAASCSDANANLSTCNLISGPGTYNGSQICFTPAGAGTFTFVLQATDACGATDLDTSVVTVTTNVAPIANCHGDTTIFACSLAQICIPGFSVSDANNNITTTVVTGGTLNAGSVCLTPVVGANNIRLIVTDACGLADTCQTIVTVVLNAAPVANAGADQNLLCQTPGQSICWAASCTDPNSNLTDCSLVSGPGTYNGTQICFTPASSGTFSFVLKATDACGATDFDTAVVTVRLNNAPTASVDQGDTTIFCSETGPMQICVPFSYADMNGNVQSVSVNPAPTTLNFANGSGLFCFTPANAFDDIYSYTVTVTDSCGLIAQSTHTRWVRFIDCDTATCFIVKTEKTHNTLQGHYEFVSVTIEGAGQEFGGFDFLMSYDNSALNFVEAKPGDMLTTCGWEYFTYRYGAQGNCNGSCPSGLVRIVSVADANNGANHPSCFGPALPSPQELFVLKFLVTNDRTFECQYVPVSFFWLDCGDNAISTVTGDTLYLEKRIFSFEGNAVWDEFDDALFPEHSRPFGVGALDFCMLGDKYEPIRCIEFWIGGIDIVCADSIDAPGDLNLNGIGYEIADAVMYTNYFLYGLAALDPDPMRREAQIAASDVNRDGSSLSVGDLVYLIRVVVGDALPFNKLTPFANSVIVKQEGSVVSSDANVEIGAALLVFNVGESYSISSLTDMTVSTNEMNGQVRVLIYDISSNSIAAGSTALLEVTGDAELVSADVADYNGSMMTARLEKNVLPTSFALGQNYPNPFNPETVIEFALPKSANVMITVYNTTGQKVATVLNNVMSAGRHQVRWDGKDSGGNTVSSGVYLYKFESEGFSETRKMLLVK
ncbi:MAG: T9SS type A sorting domain-containing protein [bacterium]|nr:T9SS type A sorting domain-containing protein [bacterium]